MSDSTSSQSIHQPRQLVLTKKSQRWVFRYLPGEEAAVLRSMAHAAADPQADFDWFDAAVLCHQMGRGLNEQLKSMMPST